MGVGARLLPGVHFGYCVDVCHSAVDLPLALTNTLRLNYPAVQRLVGEDFFAAAADIFITQEPPRMPSGGAPSKSRMEAMVLVFVPAGANAAFFVVNETSLPATVTRRSARSTTNSPVRKTGGSACSSE